MEHKTFEQVTSQALIFLRDKLSRADGTLHYYHCKWLPIKRYMQSQCINFIDTEVCKVCLLQKFGNRDYGTFSKNEKDTIKAFNVLIEFIEIGIIQPAKEVTDFKGPIGELMINYLSFKTSQRLAKHTIDEYEQHLFRFLRFQKEKSAVSINTVNQLHILNYIKSINPQTISLAHISIRTLRDFFKYLYAQYNTTQNSDHWLS